MYDQQGTPARGTQDATAIAITVMPDPYADREPKEAQLGA